MENLYNNKNFLSFLFKELNITSAKELPEDINSDSDLNNGYCIYVAKYLQTIYPNATFYTIGNIFNYHVFIMHNNKYYDATSLNGTDSINNLEWSKQHPKSIS